MDQLDILKKDWDTQNVSYPKYWPDCICTYAI